MTRRATGCAVIAGSGFARFARGAGRHMLTAYGAPSAPVRELDLGGCRVLFLARHGDELAIPPHRINYRANAMALKLAGAESVLALNTVGAIRGQHAPGTLAVPDQLIDYSFARDHSFQDGTSATLEHIDFTEPFCPRLRRAVLAAADSAGVDCHDGGVYAVTQGPRLETAAEVDRLERDGASFIGMTAMPEASLARELDMRYACLSLIVNRAAGRGPGAIHADIEASTATAREQAIRVLQAFFKAGAGADS